MTATDRAAASPVARWSWLPWLPGPVALAVAVVGLLLTGFLTWAAYSSDRHARNSLLSLDVGQAASAVSAALPSVEAKLDGALTVAGATNSPATFDRFAQTEVGPPSGFASESLWRRTGSSVAMLTYVGAKPQILAGGEAAKFISGSEPGRAHVTSILAGSPRRLGYSVSSATGDYIVYAENDLPDPTALKVPRSSPFGQLNYAIYIGSRTSDDLLESSVPVPVRGHSAAVTVPFGDSSIIVVAVPRDRLTSEVSADLPWVALFVGLVLSVASAATVEYVSRRRRRAEMLAGEVSRLYAEQRSIAATLQEALLPQQLPSVTGLEVAARYIAGTIGVDVGGDWYDVVPVGPGRVVFVVGDVSGRGVKAAAVMASLRFASRAFALQGSSPGEILDLLRKTLDFGDDRHFATVLCGQLDIPEHRLTLASAGHLPPILAGGGTARALEVAPAPPIGLSVRTGAPMAVLTVPAGSTLLAYTDGLVERRYESLDHSIDRLRAVATGNEAPLDDMLAKIITELTMDEPSDDVALIGLRWRN